jgi:TolA-binding protein
MNWLLNVPNRELYPVMHLESVDGIDHTYTGKYSNNKVFISLFKDLGRIREQALIRVQQITGLEITNQNRYIIRFVDTSPTSRFGASSRPVRSEAGDIMLVTVSAEQFMLGIIDFEDLLVHEFIHTVMWDNMGDQAYKDLPKWIREGIAVWGAGQLSEIARNIIASALMQKESAAWVVEELTTMYNSNDQYFSGAIMLDAIEKKYGSGTVKAIIKDICQNENYVQAMKNNSQVSWSQITTLAKVHIRKFAKEMVAGSGMQLFQNAHHANNIGLRQQAIDYLLDLVHNCSDDILKPKAWYWIGRWRQAKKKYDLAAMAFANVIYLFPGHIGLQSDSMLRLASCQIELNNPAEAARALNWFFQTADSHEISEALFLAGRIYLIYKDYPRAIRYFQSSGRNTRSFSAKLLYYLSLAYSKSGDSFNSKLAQAELAYRFPNSSYLTK